MSEQFDTEKSMLYKLWNSQDLVLMNNNVLTPGEVVSHKQQSMPTATINYHDIMRDDQNPDPKAFSLELKHEIYALFQNLEEK